MPPAGKANYRSLAIPYSKMTSRGAYTPLGIAALLRSISTCRDNKHRPWKELQQSR